MIFLLRAIDKKFKVVILCEYSIIVALSHA